MPRGKCLKGYLQGWRDGSVTEGIHSFLEGSSSPTSTSACNSRFRGSDTWSLPSALHPHTPTHRHVHTHNLKKKFLILKSPSVRTISVETEKEFVIDEG